MVVAFFATSYKMHDNEKNGHFADVSKIVGESQHFMQYYPITITSYCNYCPFYERKIIFERCYLCPSVDGTAS